jgi:DNA-binding XRE family transcriptional regulator
LFSWTGTLSKEEKNYREWRDNFLATPEHRALYEEESAKSELWFQLVEARQQAGLTQKELAERIGVTQSQVARIEKRGYDAYTLNTLRKYVAALGEGYSLEVRIHTPEEEPSRL